MTLTKLRFFLICITLLQSCDDDAINSKFTEDVIELSTHRLAAYSAIKNSKFLVVFEAGLGDDHKVWESKSVASRISESTDVIMYDRAGYGKSETGSAPRDIDKLRQEMEFVINTYWDQRKIILIGHSLGAMIIRDYAVKNPDRVAGLLFVDPSHEYYNQPTQQIEDEIYQAFKNSYGENFGATMEARELIEDSEYMSTLSELPDVPTIVLTSLKTDEAHDTADRQHWYNSHELLQEGVSDFLHVTTTKSGHYIMKDEPDLIVDNLNALLLKLQ